MIVRRTVDLLNMSRRNARRGIRGMLAMLAAKTSGSLRLRSPPRQRYIHSNISF
jgi:hypothetical protein